ncbi:hypothetical protein Tco_0318482 [Tanacetum coccineum]
MCVGRVMFITGISRGKILNHFIARTLFKMNSRIKNYNGMIMEAQEGLSIEIHSPSSFSSLQDETKLCIAARSYVLTATVNVPVMYLQQFWRTVSNVPDTEDTIKFKLDTQKDYIQYPRFTKLIIADLMKKYETISPRIKEDYHSIKDDIPLVSVYTTGNVTMRGMLLPNEFLTEKIRATDDYKEYKTVFVGVDVPMNQPQPGKKRKQHARETSSLRKPLKVTIRQKKHCTPSIPPLGDDRERDEVAKATILSITLHKTALAAEAQENIAKVQEKLDEEEIEKMVEGDEVEESYASEFADSMINDDADDSSTMIEPGSHKEHPENVNDDDEEIEKEMKDDEIEKEEKNDDVEKTDEVVKEKDNDEGALGSMEFRNKKK